MKCLFLTAGLICLSLTSGLAQSKPQAIVGRSRMEKLRDAIPVIENMYAKYVEDHHVPGLAFGIVAEGELIYSGNIGVQQTTSGEKVSSASVFRIASMTKSITALAILKLRDSGKLRLDDPVVKYIPNLKTLLPVAYAKLITIRNLLTHTAGFPEDNPWADRQLDMTEKELDVFLKKGVSMAYTPGKSFEYSNLGFALLGQIIRITSKESFESYITRTILLPLKMQHTYWEYSEVPSKDLVHGYRLENGEWKEEALLHSGVFGATGGLMTTVEDFSRYMMLHLTSSETANHTVTEMHSQGVITRMRRQRGQIQTTCPTMVSYNDGLSWSKDCSDRTTLQHSGGLPGFGSHWAMMPEYDLAVVSMTNLTYAAPDLLNLAVLDTLIELAGVERRTTPVSDILNKRQEQLIKLLPSWSAAEKSGIFSESFFLDYPIQQLKEEAKTLFEKAGRVKSVGPMIPVNDLRGYFTIECENVNLNVWFTLTPENPALIQEYKLTESSR